jgi:hypothetical protein
VHDPVLELPLVVHCLGITLVSLGRGFEWLISGFVGIIGPVAMAEIDEIFATRRLVTLFGLRSAGGSARTITLHFNFVARIRRPGGFP